MNVQVIADPAGRLIWASPALPGARHDMGAAREHGIVEAINTAGVQAVADTAYRAAAPRYACGSVAVAWISTPAATGRCPAASGRSTPRTPSRRGPGERANGELKSWKILRNIRASPSRANTRRPGRSAPDPRGLTKLERLMELNKCETSRSPSAGIRSGYDRSRSRYPAAMVDPAGGSFVLRYARVTSTAVQTGAESARVMSVTDVSTEHTNRHRATDPAPRAAGRRDRVQPATP